MTPETYKPVLDPKTHARILADKENLARVANIPVSMLFESAKKYCDPAEIDWLTRFPVNRRMNRGLVLTGNHTPPPEIKMMAMTAALVRNYVDARVITAQALLQSIEDGKGEVPDPTVMFVPNLFVRHGGKGLPAWKVQILYDLLLSRFTAGKVSVLYVESMDAMGAEYGHTFTGHFEANYVFSNS